MCKIRKAERGRRGEGGEEEGKGGEGREGEGMGGKGRGEEDEVIFVDDCSS